MTSTFLFVSSLLLLCYDVSVATSRAKRATTTSCADNRRECATWLRQGYSCNQIKTYCKKTCGLCKVSTASVKPVVCKDVHAKCRYFSKTYCDSATYKVWMGKNCAGFCSADRNAYCSQWARQGECQKNPVYMLTNCKTSCGLCKTVKPTKKTTPRKSTPKPTTKKTTRNPTTKPTQKPTQKPPSQVRCGLPKIPALLRIVGGKKAQPGVWPWHVGITRCRNCPNTIPYCGGTLIDNEWVVTAAHCVDSDLASHLFVILGDTDINKTSGHEVIVGVKRIIVHKKFNDVTIYNNDMALLRLSKAVKYTNHIRPACLPQQSTKLPAGKLCTVTGFGKTQERGLKSLHLQKVALPLVSAQECKKALGVSKITDNMICAGHITGKKDACQGDSGGPMVCQSSAGRWQLTGVVSWGKGCARADKYGVYADVQVLRKWIVTNIIKNGGHWNDS